ncbi:hypothetical protein QVD17_30028 [Tagetes erecta]|uniref:Uncharacterized protein n=1 Tax=Tagetes erecta TaxID=13708 RepID=A0AAD8K215_TARER|nr:hypothetical protein QVD17_30028 [Tagetes erecta]
MIGNIVRFGRRQVHTIISREIIKPSSPTPSHLRTYNLSQLDLYTPCIYTPLILFYPNNKSYNLTPNDKAQEMKKALSHTLTQYYPFAGRLLTPTSPYVDCNDEGVVFVEAKHDSPLDKFQNMSEEDDAVGQFFADGMVWQNAPHSTSLVGVQLNHFACGGMAVAVSILHRICDASTISSYVSHWASVARFGSIDHKHVMSNNPHYIQSPSIPDYPPLESSFLKRKCSNHVTRKFVFPNTKLNELKNKVLALAEGGSTLSIHNILTRFEVLSCLLYKTAMASTTTTRSSSLSKTYFLLSPMDIRKKLKLPQTTVGNLLAGMLVTTRHTSETSLSMVLSEIKREKMELERVQSVQMASQKFGSLMSRLMNADVENVADRCFWCSSLCGFPFNKVDFGWGKPTNARITYRSSDLCGFVLMDTPNEDGIEAWVTLESQDMEIFQNDKEMLLFCQK